MMNIKALIVDDETRNRQIIVKMLKTYCPQITDYNEASNVEEAKKLTETYQPHIVFLDVEMPPYSGFDYLKSLNTIEFELIFVTAYNHYAMQAIKYSALDYLLKPVDIDDLKLAVQKAVANIQNRTLPDPNRFQVLLQESKPLETMVVHSLKDSRIVSLPNIIYIQADDSYSMIYLQNGEQIVSSKHLLEYDKLLSTNDFFRVHKSYLINLRHINKIVKGENAGVEMSNGEVLPIARRRKEEFIERMKLR